MLEEETGLQYLGCLPEVEGCGFESRHLGLVTAGEIGDLQGKLDRLADAAAESIDLDGLLALAAQAPEISDTLILPPAPKTKVKIALARDEAFAFTMNPPWTSCAPWGRRSWKFSPLRDKKLPRGAAALYLGGGYPELHGQVLAENTEMREAIRAAVLAGMPTMAECGGFCTSTAPFRSRAVTPGSWPGAGRRGLPHGEALPFGYVTLKAKGGIACSLPPGRRCPPTSSTIGTPPTPAAPSRRKSP